MATTTSDPRFELRQVTEIEWIIRDHRYGLHDSRCTVACIWQVDEDECEVNWLRDFALPTRYVSAADVLADLNGAWLRHTKPIPIPHFAPGASARHDEAMPA